MPGECENEPLHAFRLRLNPGCERPARVTETPQSCNSPAPLLTMRGLVGQCLSASGTAADIASASGIDSRCRVNHRRAPRVKLLSVLLPALIWRFAYEYRAQNTFECVRGRAAGRIGAGRARGRDHAL